MSENTKVSPTAPTETDATYTCEGCGDVVLPHEDQSRAALLVGDAQHLLCGECGRRIRSREIEL